MEKCNRTLSEEMQLSKLVLVSKIDNKISYFAENKFQSNNKKNDMVETLSKLLNNKCKVIAIVNSKNIEYAIQKGELPPVLDEICETFSGGLKVVENLDLEIFKKERGVLVKNIGAVLTARSFDEVETMVRIVEKNAFCLSKCQSYVTIPDWQSKIVNFFFMNFYSKNNQIKQWNNELGIKTQKSKKAKINNDDIEVKNLIVETAKKLYDEKLIQGTWGNISIRINENELLCTPKGVGYNILTNQDIVKMNYWDESILSKGVPTSEKGIHCKIMRTRPQAQVAIHAHPLYCSIFAIQNEDLVVDKGSVGILGNKVYCSMHKPPTTKALVKNTVDAMKNSKACFMGNHGVMVYGESVDDALKVLCTLEKECKKFVEKS